MSKAGDIAVAVAPSREIAEMWAGLLVEAGIAYRLTPAQVGDTGLVPSLAAWEVRVDAIDATRALELLPSADADDLDEDEDQEDENGDDAYDPDLDAPPAASGGSSLRWVIIALAVAIALIIVFVGARYAG
ncbi:MAG TPA: hypothetical protein VGL99_10635 [Chloroflexota bacterium]